MYIILFKCTIVAIISSIVSLKNNSQFATEIINFYYFPSGFT